MGSPNMRSSLGLDAYDTPYSPFRKSCSGDFFRLSQAKIKAYLVAKFSRFVDIWTAQEHNNAIIFSE